MATCFIPVRDAAVITRIATITNAIFTDRLFVSQKDDSELQTLETAKEIGISTGRGTAWLEFGEGPDGQLLNMAVYGVASVDAAYLIAADLGIEIVSEHDEDFSYHEFPVDVNTIEPTYKIDQWEGFLVDGYIYPYNRAQGMAGFYFAHQYEEQCGGIDAFVAAVNNIKEEYEL